MNENQIFFTLHYIEHRGKFYHHFLDFLSLSGLISRFVRSLWPESSEKEIDINIYLHCVVPKNISHSVNYLQYKRSEIKEKNIYLFSYAMLISAMDCQLNYYQNYQSNKEDYSAPCYFQKCEYLL